MESKFFSEIEKNMDVKTLNDFEKEVRAKINKEFESLRAKNDNLSRILMTGECEMWGKIRDEMRVIKRRNFSDLLTFIRNLKIYLILLKI